MLSNNFLLPTTLILPLSGYRVGKLSQLSDLILDQKNFLMIGGVGKMHQKFSSNFSCSVLIGYQSQNRLQN